MVLLRPTAAFASVPLERHTVHAGESFKRIFLSRFPDPLGFGKSPSRFSDPRRRKESSRFGVLYLGETLKVCFLEAILRDRRNGAIGDLPVGENELKIRHHARVEVAAPHSLVDLRGDCAVRMGVPSDVHRASKQTLARHWSAAFYEHPECPDGVIYPSRLNGHTNLAVYERAVSKLRLSSVESLLDSHELPAVLNDLRVAISF